MCLSERLVHSILKVWLLWLPLCLCFLDSGKQSSPFMRMQRPDKLMHIFVVMTIPILLLDELGLMRHSHIHRCVPIGPHAWAACLPLCT